MCMPVLSACAGEKEWKKSELQTQEADRQGGLAQRHPPFLHPSSLLSSLSRFCLSSLWAPQVGVGEEEALDRENGSHIHCWLAG